jgi:ferredoxin
MAEVSRTLERWARRGLARADGLMNGLYGWRYNPLYQSGPLVLVLMAVVLVTGIYLLFFYRIGSPYESVAGLTDQAWLGRWIRSLHRYASDAAVPAILVHAFRMYAQRRAWGPRALAWVSGVILLGVTLVCGWTGYVMVWDLQGIALAREGARFLDSLPLFSEPIGRAFVGERIIPRAFFFLNLFLHVALPVGIGVVLWIHVARVARPVLLPPRRLAYGVGALLLALAVFWPVGMAPAADLFRLPERAPFDLFYSFWLPLTLRLPAWTVWVLGGAAAALAVAVPWLARPKPRPVPSVVNWKLCDGCRQCYLDCPYEAISMVQREGSRTGIVSQVDPALCVGCGICAGSCAPMGVGPPRRSGRDQLDEVRRFIAVEGLRRRDIVMVTCDQGIGEVIGRVTGAGVGAERVPVFGVDCAGSMHTSVIEYLVRSGVGGVLIVACPPRDCWSREGPKWLEGRMYHDREAELKPRVDRRRVRVVHAGQGDVVRLRRQVAGFRADIAALEAAGKEDRIELDDECRAAEVEA